ncbi:hypothetical protein H2248_006614 [Termitomyces sp. 'cryptogamus']|nr:hypothetical protein H2248_006614 [Termitomyces sp. 'cryptogamus']
MDVVLDLHTLKENDEFIAELLRSFHVCLSRYAPAVEYPGGLMSLDKYWIEEYAHWTSTTRPIEDGISTRFPESYERSTAFQPV